MLRTAAKSDAAQIAELFRQLHEFHVNAQPESYRMPQEEFFRRRADEMLSDEDSAVLVNDDGGINAYAAVKILDIRSEEKYPRRVCYVDCFAVAEGFRREGVGRRLMDYVKEYALQNGCSRVRLGTAAFNSGALAFYEKMGFTPRTIISALKLTDEKENNNDDL